MLRRFESADPVDVGARMAFVIFLLSTWVTTEQAAFKLPLRAIAVVALVAPPLHRDPRTWAALAFFLCAKSLRNWWTQDNHIFLLTWFSVGMTLSLWSADPLRAARENGRRLIGLAFAFAALWKGPVSGEFLNGSYFTFTFLTDPRFHGFARAIAGVPEEALRASYAAAARLGAPDAGAVVLEGLSTRLHVVAITVAWWTFAIESALAVTFLAPASWPRLGRSRHAFLLLFGATTYMAADVETFGWSLMAIGAVQSEPERPDLRALYLAVGILILAYDYVPVFELLAARL